MRRTKPDGGSESTARLRRHEGWNYKRPYMVPFPLPLLLADVYTLEEFMADICTDENPCAWCRERDNEALQS